MTIRARTLLPAALLWVAAFLLPAAPAAAQHAHGHAAMPTSGLRAELIRDVEQLEEKYLGLAEAMAGKYQWRPAEGVRSVGEVLMHVANSNHFFAGMAGTPMPAELQGSTMEETRARLQAREKITDKEEAKKALRDAFAHVRQAIAAVPDDQLDAPVQLFGQEATKRRLLTLLVTHMHEHLGQSIAYARTNDVTPPWSGGN